MNDLLDKYVLSLGYIIIDDLDSNTFNTNTIFSIRCKVNPDHVFKANITNLKSNKLDIKDNCPHCRKDSKYIEKGLPYADVNSWAVRNNHSVVTYKEYYNKWKDSIEFKCNKCSHLHVVKSVSHFEKNISEKYECNSCKLIELQNKLPDHQPTVIQNIKEKHNTKKYVNLPNTIWSKKPTPEFLNKLTTSKTVWHIVNYNGTRQKCDVMCRNCGITKKAYPNLILHPKNTGCSNCRKGLNRFQVESKILNICEENNLTLSEVDFEYKNIHSSIDLICNVCGNTFTKNWAEITGLYYKINCKQCKPRSIKEKSVATYVKSLGVDVVENDFSVISPYELDVYIPSKNLAIEFCGNVWHSTLYNHDNNKHYDKFKKCQDKGITLLTLFEDEWDDKQDICKSIIKNKIIGSSTIIYARKCEVKEVDDPVKVKEFLDSNHIQGRCNYNHAIGLFYNNEMVQVSTFTKCRNSQKEDYDLSRLCGKINTNIIGGASKILSSFRNKYTGSICSFADLRISNGNVYNKLGFTDQYTIKPRYTYVGDITKWKRKHRFGFNKSKLIDKYGSEFTNMTEFEIAQSNGLYRLYDCGYKKYVMM